MLMQKKIFHCVLQTTDKINQTRGHNYDIHQIQKKKKKKKNEVELKEN